jgi:hypothetical protein
MPDPYAADPTPALYAYNAEHGPYLVGEIRVIIPTLALSRDELPKASQQRV